MYNLDERCKMVRLPDDISSICIHHLLIIDSPLDTEVLTGNIRETCVFCRSQIKSRNICFCVIFSLGFWQQVSKLCSFTRRSREEDLEWSYLRFLGLLQSTTYGSKIHKDSSWQFPDRRHFWPIKVNVRRRVVFVKKEKKLHLF